MTHVGPRHALRAEPVIPRPRRGDSARTGPPVPLARPAPPQAGPWVPPLPVPQPGLSRRMGVVLAVSVIGLVTATVTVIGIDVREATARQAVGPAPTSVESAFLSTVRAHSTLTAVSDADLVSAGHTVCLTLDAHPNRTGVFGTLDTLTGPDGWSAGDAAAVVGSAVGVLCPEYRPLLR